jgi:hypothetical protein
MYTDCPFVQADEWQLIVICIGNNDRTVYPIDHSNPTPPGRRLCSPRTSPLSKCGSTRAFSKGQLVGFHPTGSSLALNHTFLVSSLPNISITGVMTGRMAKSVEKLISATSRMFTQYSSPIEAKYTHAKLPIDHQTRPWIR